MKHPLLINSNGKIKKISHRVVIMVKGRAIGATTMLSSLTKYATDKNLTIHTIKV